MLAIPAPLLGLDLGGCGSDDLDALYFNDADGSFSLTPGDTIAFSVRRGSFVIGLPDSAFGFPIEPGDVLTVPTGAGLPPAIPIAAEALGLVTVRTHAVAFGADLDALDIVGSAKTPSANWLSLSLLAGGLLGLGLRSFARRRTRQPAT